MEGTLAAANSFNLITEISLMVLLLPLFSFLFLFPFAKKLPGKGDWLATIFTGLSFLLSVFIFIKVWGAPAHYTRFNWFYLQDFKAAKVFTISILVDSISAIMMVVVTLISLLVHVYSIEYMKGKMNYSRYFPYLGIFTFSMLGIVLSDNLLVTFIFWEMVGFSSYLLIGFWFHKEAAVQASKKAFLFNRIGDIGFLLGIFFFYTEFGSFELSTIKQMATENSFLLRTDIWITLAGLGLFCGCVGKSAQFPLHVWLPDAMEGPTPVSALIHAATMVAAGVYLLAKVFLLLNTDVLNVIAFIGAFTAFIGAIPALVQTDIKKVLAYSTISQLGYMVMGMGVGAYEASLFHLVTHAFFKACLFLSVGAIIHSMHHIKHDLFNKGVFTDFDSQDMRLMGGLRKRMPITFYSYTLAALALIGIPFFSGFLSKDAILIGAWAWAQESSKNNFMFYMVPFFGFATVLITAIYIGRQFLLVFATDLRLINVYEEVKDSINTIHDPSWFMKGPMILLGFGSLGIVFSLNPFDAGSSWFMSALDFKSLHSDKLTHFSILIISTTLAVFGLFIANRNFRKKAFNMENQTNTGALNPSFIHKLLSNNLYLDSIYYKALSPGICHK